MIKFTKTIDISEENNKNNSFSYDNNYKNSKESRKDSFIAKKIIDNPNMPIKLNEDDLHSAIRKTSELPEQTLTNMLEVFKLHLQRTKSNKDPYLAKELEHEINIQIINKFNIFLNKSLVNISKIAKKNSDIFKSFKNFWCTLENEIFLRQDSLTNEQITDFVCSFVKADLNSTMT